MVSQMVHFTTTASSLQTKPSSLGRSVDLSRVGSVAVGERRHLAIHFTIGGRERKALLIWSFHCTLVHILVHRTILSLPLKAKSLTVGNSTYPASEKEWL